MLRELIEKEAAAVKGAVHAFREWIHPTKVSEVTKRDERNRATDDRGQSVEDVERRGPKGSGAAGRE